MSSVLRKLIMKKSKKESDARQRLKKELFAYTRGLNLGFPNKPTSIDYDSILSLIAIGTRTGSIRIYGAPGVELYAQHPDDSSVTQVCFLPGQARLISLCLDDSVNLWEVDLNTDLTSLKRVKTLTPNESKMDDLFRCCVFRGGSSLLIMNRGGFMLEVDAIKFSVIVNGQGTLHTVHLSAILNGVPSDLTASIGRVVSFLLQPSTVDKFLIGYSSGLIIMWDHCNKKSIRYFNANQFTESLSFSPDGSEFVSSHFDGSYIVWSSENSSRPKDQPACPYGPFPCSSIHAIKWRPMKSGDTYLFFSGGMPRASHSDKNTVTVMNHSSDHVVFELSSRIIDFVIVVTNDDDQVEEEALSLLILAEEEFVAIDLLSPDWPTFELPYMQNIHSSPVLCSTYSCDAYPFIVDALVENAMLKISSSPKISPRDWPITGGKNLNKKTDSYKLLLLGHEDGSIEFFSPVRTGMKHIYKVNTAKYFVQSISQLTLNCTDDRGDKKSLDLDSDDDFINGRRYLDDLDEWPPFRKVGSFDPRGVNPQLSIRHLLLSRHGRLFIAAGNSGQIMVFEFFRKEQLSKERADVTTMTVNIVEKNSGYSWVGHEPLVFNPAKASLTQNAGYHLTVVIQVIPPVEPTCITFDEDTSLISIGTVYGYAVFDLQNCKVVMTKRTLAIQGSSRFLFKAGSMSFRKSFGESFRKLRHRKGGNASVGGAQPKESSTSGAQNTSREAIQASSGDDGQRQSSSVVSRSSETSPSSSKPHPTGSSSSHTLPIFPSSSSAPTNSQRQRSNSDTRSNPELTEDDSEYEEDAENRSRSRNSRRSTPSRSVNEHNTQKLVRPKRISGAFKKVGGGCQVEEPKITEVSTLSFARTFLTSGQPSVLTLWVGTSIGGVFVHQLDVPPLEKRLNEGVSCCLAKEINFKRHHPIMFMSVLSRSMRPISREASENNDIDVDGHSVIIVTQGQFKLFSLPSLKMTAKYNLLGVPESPRICKADIVSFISKSDENYVEHNLVCLTSHDHLMVFNFPQLKIQLRINNLKIDSGMYQRSLISPYGEVLLFNSSSELCHLSLSTHSSIQNWCSVDLKPGSTRLPIQQGVGGNGTFGNGEDLFQEPPVPHVVVSEHLDDGGDDGDAEERPAESDHNDTPLTSSRSQMFQSTAQQPLVSPDSESELSGSVSLSSHIPSSTPFVMRSVTSSRTILSRSTISRSINGEIITESSADLERINIGAPHGNQGSLESDV